MDCAQKARCAKNIGSIGGQQTIFLCSFFFELEPKTAHCSKIKYSVYDKNNHSQQSSNQITFSNMDID